MLRGDFQRLESAPTTKDAAKEQLLLKIKDLTKSYKIRKSSTIRIEIGCENPECSLNIGYYLSKEKWNKIRKWCETHIPDCPYSGSMKTLPRALVNKAVEIAIRDGDTGYHDIKSVAKNLYGKFELNDDMRRVLKNSKYTILNRNLLTGPKFEENIEMWYDELEAKNYKVAKAETSKGETMIRILVPQYEAIATAFHSPLFLDGTFSCNNKTLIHVSAVTTSNRILMIGIVVSPTECSEAVTFLMSPILKTGPTHCVMTDEGKAMKKGLDMCRVKYIHTLCSFHLSRQVPTKKSGKKTKKNETLANVFIGAARATTSTYEDLIESIKIKGSGKLALKLEGAKEKWSREYVRGMRRDYIASLSEGLNGAIKKYIEGPKRWSMLLTAFIEQAENAFLSSVSEAEKFIDREDFVMPIGRKYMDINTDLAKKSLDVIEEETCYKVYLGEVLLGEVTRDSDKYKCTCNYKKDIGLPCIHILAVDESAAYNKNEINKIWFTSTFINTFLGERKEVESQGAYTRGEERKKEEKKKEKTSGNKKENEGNNTLIDFLKTHKLSEEKQKEIIKLLMEGESK